MKIIEIPDELYLALLEETLKGNHREVHVFIKYLLQQKNQREVISHNPLFSNGTGKNLVTKGGHIPHGTKLQCAYKGRTFSGLVDDGAIVVEGERFRSPGEAAIYVAKLQGNDRASINGWIFWKYFDSLTNEWEVLDNLRKKSTQRTAAMTETSNISQSNGKNPDQGEIFVCKGKQANAKGKWLRDMFVVLEGSFVNLEEAGALQKRYRKIRRGLLGDGSLRREGNCLKFIRNAEFNSLSEAACVVLGRSANGRTEWMLEKPTPEVFWQYLILRLLNNSGEALEAPTVMERIYKGYKDKMFSVADLLNYENSKEPAWQHYIRLAGENLIKKGSLKKGLPHGLWEITESGKKEFSRLRDYLRENLGVKS